MAPSLATRELNLRIAPVLGYVGQRVAPTPEVVAAGRVAANRLLHLPHNCQPTAVWRRLDGLGMVQPRLIDTAARAALASARRRIADHRRYGVQILRSAAGEGATLAQLRNQRIEPRGWAAPEFAHTLEAPFLVAPMEVSVFEPALARLDLVADVEGPLTGIYEAIRYAATLEKAAEVLAGRARFLAQLDEADAIASTAQILAAMERVRHCSPAHGRMDDEPPDTARRAAMPVRVLRAGGAGHLATHDVLPGVVERSHRSNRHRAGPHLQRPSGPHRL